MAKIFLFFWCISGLLTLDAVFHSPRPRPAPPTFREAADTLPVVMQIKTRCELPAGTVVFVVRGREASP
jgi:hypothetical protein